MSWQAPTSTLARMGRVIDVAHRNRPLYRFTAKVKMQGHRYRVYYYLDSNPHAMSVPLPNWHTAMFVADAWVNGTHPHQDHIVKTGHTPRSLSILEDSIIMSGDNHAH